MTFQRKLEKLENTQNYATELLKMKYHSFMEVEKDSNQRYNQCLSQRTNMQRNRQLSHSLFERNKNFQLRKIKEEQHRVSQEKKKSKERS